MNNNFATPILATSAASSAFVVTPDDDNDLDQFATRGLYIGAAGAITVDLVGGGREIVFTAVPIGFFPVQVRRVYNTGTAASDIIALF